MASKFRYKKEISELVIALIVIITIGGFVFLVKIDQENRLENPNTDNPGRPNVQDVFDREKELEQILEEELGISDSESN